NRLLTGTALTVNGDTGHLFRIAGGQPGQPRDVSGLWSDRVDAARDHVVDRAGIDVHAPEQAAPRRRPEVDRMHAGQRPVALANRGAYSVNDVRLRRRSRVRLLLSICRQELLRGTAGRPDQPSAVRPADTNGPRPMWCRG